MRLWGQRPIPAARAACRIATLILALFFPGAAPAVTGQPPAPGNSLGMSDTCYLQAMMYDVIIDGVVESLVVKKTDPENGAVWCRSELRVKVLRSVLGECPTGLVRVVSWSLPIAALTDGSVRGCLHLADSPPPPAPGTRGVFLLTGLPLAYRFHTIVPRVATLDIVEHEFLARRPDHTLRVVDEFGAEHIWPYDAYLDSLAVAARSLTLASMIDAADVVVLGRLEGRYFDRDASSVLASYWWFQVKRILAGCPVPERVVARVEVDQRPIPDRVIARIEHRVVDERFKRLSALETQVVVFADTLPGGQIEPVGLGALAVESDGSIALPFPRVGEHVETQYLPLSAVPAR